ncbi:MAG: dehydrogenase (quinone) [Deltaproteobacteria bacterium]|jgi:multicomponent Na+:H+ antiporter subunit A|nr:dehydrogenase (quinone) [Deltaproteobacteria bacterium]
MELIVAVLSGFVLALIAPWIYRIARGATGWLLAIFPSILFAYFLRSVEVIAGGDALRVYYPWVASLGINLSFYLDGLSLLFGLLITGIGALVLVYTGGYLKDHPHLGRFYGFLLMFMASMLGVVLADNTICLFLFWELTSVSSFLLIGFEHEKETSRAAALQALLVTSLGGLALLGGFLLLDQAGGSRELSLLLSRGDAIRSHSLYVPIVLLVVVGAFTKSAQFPFHFWLPAAMEAPTPVSAYLHSATMVKAGVYLLARMTPALADTSLWTGALTGFGAVTMLFAAVLAFRQSDLKLILAYSTISALGIMVMLLGVGTPLALQAMIVFLFGHALYKGALFMLAGAIDHETGTRDVNRLSGLRSAMPASAAAALLAAMSMAAVPMLFGFYGKELFYEALATEPTQVLLIASVITSMIFVAVAILAGIKPFIGEKVSTPKHAHEAPITLLFGPVILAGTSLILGVLPSVIDTSVLLPPIRAVLRKPISLELALWHGINPIFLLSMATLASGAALFAFRDRLLSLSRPLASLRDWGPKHGYSLALAGLNATAKAQTRLLQSGYLRYYLLIVIATATVLSGYKLLQHIESDTLGRPMDFSFYEAALAMLILLAAFMATQARSRLAAIAALGVVGFSVALVFVLFSAPDLAMTQFSIETLTVIVFVLALYHLPRFGNLSSAWTRARDASVALTAGALITLMALTATGVQLHPKISTYFTENSVSLAHGHNIVNVILVDFRGLDTLGEITVLAIAAVGVYGLLKLRLDKEESK